MRRDKQSNSKMHKQTLTKALRQSKMTSCLQLTDFPFPSSFRVPREKSRQPPHWHHPARPLIQKQVHQADLSGWCCHGETNKYCNTTTACITWNGGLTCFTSFFLHLLWLLRCHWWLLPPFLVFYCGHSPPLTLLSLLCPFLWHQFLCGYQQPSTPTPKVIIGL